ncbi:MAG: hypothetical protein ACFCVK_23720 [Acidimicrobiales bacterium]
MDEAERIEQVVFAEAFDCDRALWEAEFPPYDDRTVWVTIRHQGRMVGAVRAVVGPLTGLKIASDLQRFWGISIHDAMEAHGLSPDLGIIEAATLAVLPGDRTRDRWWPVRALSAAFCHLVVDSGATHAMYLLDPKVLRVLTMMLGFPFERLAKLEPVDFNGLMQPTLSPVSEYFSIIATSDDECRRLVVDRDPGGRGGTELPTVDVTESSPRELHRRLLAGEPRLTPTVGGSNQAKTESSRQSQGAATVLPPRRLTNNKGAANNDDTEPR